MRVQKHDLHLSKHAFCLEFSNSKPPRVIRSSHRLEQIPEAMRQIQLTIVPLVHVPQVFAKEATRILQLMKLHTGLACSAAGVKRK
jgi:hypothetical protein